MLLSNRCWNWSLDKVERSINTSMFPLRSMLPSSPPIPKALISTSSSSPDSIVIIGSGLKKNSSSSPYDEWPYHNAFRCSDVEMTFLFYDVFALVIICMHIVKRRYGCFEGRTRSPNGQESWGIPATRPGRGGYPKGISPPGEGPRASPASGKRTLRRPWQPSDRASYSGGGGETRAAWCHLPPVCAALPWAHHAI